MPEFRILEFQTCKRPGGHSVREPPKPRVNSAMRSGARASGRRKRDAEKAPLRHRVVACDLKKNGGTLL